MTERLEKNGSSAIIKVQLKLEKNAQHNFSLDIDAILSNIGVVGIFGESGSGKTTFLRCLAGLIKLGSAVVKFNDEIWQNDQIFIPAYKRSIGYVFQEDGLLPHLTVQQNIEYAVRRKKKASVQGLYEKVLLILNIEDVLDVFPDQLSGGERQRVSIARSLLQQPRILFMDEPLASLDEMRKREILPYLERISKQFVIPILYVSHSVEEIARLADHVLVFKQGRIVEEGPPNSVFANENSLIGLSDEVGVVFDGDISAWDENWELSTVTTGCGDLFIPKAGSVVGAKIRVRILAKDVSLIETPQSQSSILNQLPAEVVELSKDQNTAMRLVRVRVKSEQLVARISRKSIEQLNIVPGKSLWIQIKAAAVLN
jgi:molybdate transport system ATP-binding protein